MRKPTIAMLGMSVLSVILISGVTAKEISTPGSPSNPTVDSSGNIPQHIQRSAPASQDLIGDGGGPESQVEELRETEILPPNQAVSEPHKILNREKETGGDSQNNTTSEKSIETQSSKHNKK